MTLLSDPNTQPADTRPPPSPLAHPKPALGLNKKKAGVQIAATQNTDNDHNRTQNTGKFFLKFLDYPLLLFIFYVFLGFFFFLFFSFLLNF